MSDQEALQSTRQQRPVFHYCFTTVIKAVDARYDIRGYLLAELVMLCLKNRATVPLARRAYYRRYVPQEALTYLEHFTALLLFGPDGRLSPHEYRYVASVYSL